jgi:hypothetical protein
VNGTFRTAGLPWHHEGLTKTALGTEDGPQERLVRVLLGSESEDLGVMAIADAYQLAGELGLDLREEGNQTVRLYDHGKTAYEQEMARREAARTARRPRRAAPPDDQPQA